MARVFVACKKEFCARRLRFTVNHHGPVKHKKINPFLRRDAVSEFQGFLSA
jgi:phosphotransferase system IIB component